MRPKGQILRLGGTPAQGALTMGRTRGCRELLFSQLALFDTDPEAT